MAFASFSFRFGAPVVAAKAPFAGFLAAARRASMAIRFFSFATFSTQTFSSSWARRASFAALFADLFACLKAFRACLKCRLADPALSFVSWAAFSKYWALVVAA